jgi:hypothetical protein
MARWSPGANEAIGANEPLGRRLFDEPLLAGAQDQSPPIGLLDIRNFQEKRDREYSLDRLGKTGIDRSVKSFLLDLANDAATKFSPPKSFNGWAIIRANQFAKANPTVPCVASRITGEGTRENPYHAHALRPENTAEIHFALQLRHLFNAHGSIEFSTRSSIRNSALSIKILWQRTKNWFRRDS